MSKDRDYYCDRKFNELMLNFELKTVSACCAAEQQQIDFDDLKINGLLNISSVKNERKQMLSNLRVNSCENTCWKVEDDHLPSIRLIRQSNTGMYQNSHVSDLTCMNIYLGSRCTLTCSYCSKDSSRAWTEELKKNGDYQINGSDASIYKISKKNQIVNQIKQDFLYTGPQFQTLYDQLNECKDYISTWYIAGGEPFLYEQQLLDLIKIIPPTAEIIILTGLGLPKNKFVKLISILQTYPNFKLGISAENLNALYEFNRYGNTFFHFLEMLNLIKAANIKYQFYSTLSNITAFGYIDFLNFVDAEIEETVCVNPAFLKVQNIDDDSKYQLLELLDKQNNKKFKVLIELLQSEYQVAPTDQKNLAIFLKEFSARRNLNLNIFPKTFLKWLDIHVVQ